jgi:DNA-binding GntR family transcriptional regulator
MRKPETIERVYMDFDGFFASVEVLADKRLRGRPVGVVPFEGTTRTAIIACSREAKMYGVKNVMPVDEAKRLCPDIVLVPQKPDLYRRAHNALLSEIEAVIPIDTAKSIDELTCRLDENARADPDGLARKVKDAIFELVGPWITCSMGFAANRQLAKMACKESKRSGNSPLREALFMMTSQGLVVAEDYKGFMVAPLNFEDMLDVSSLRANLEAFAVAGSIRKGREDWEVELVGIFHKLKKAGIAIAKNSDDESLRTDWENNHRDFHYVLCKGCGSPWALHFFDILYDQMERYRRFFWKYAERTTIADTEHEEIAQLALARDEERTITLLKKTF